MDPETAKLIREQAMVQFAQTRRVPVQVVAAPAGMPSKRIHDEVLMVHLMAGMLAQPSTEWDDRYALAQQAYRDLLAMRTILDNAEHSDDRRAGEEVHPGEPRGDAGGDQGDARPAGGEEEPAEEAP